MQAGSALNPFCYGRLQAAPDPIDAVCRCDNSDPTNVIDRDRDFIGPAAVLVHAAAAVVSAIGVISALHAGDATNAIKVGSVSDPGECQRQAGHSKCKGAHHRLQWLAATSTLWLGFRSSIGKPPRCSDDRKVDRHRGWASDDCEGWT